MELKGIRFEGGKMMAHISMTEEDCVKFANKVFNTALGKDFNYVIQAVKEKMIRDGEIDGQETEETDDVEVEAEACVSTDRA